MFLWPAVRPNPPTRKPGGGASSGDKMGQHNWDEGPRIYNLFPLLAGPMPQWSAHIARARRDGFQLASYQSYPAIRLLG